MKLKLPLIQFCCSVNSWVACLNLHTVSFLNCVLCLANQRVSFSGSYLIFEAFSPQQASFLIAFCNQTIYFRMCLACYGPYLVQQGFFFYAVERGTLFVLPILHFFDVDADGCINFFVYLGFYVTFNTVQVISRRVVGRAEETST